MLELACKPLTESSIHGRPVTTSTLMAKDANHEGVTFTAKMQPKIDPGQAIELFFRCSELVDLISSKFLQNETKQVRPTAFVVVKEKRGEGPWTKAGQTDSIPNSNDP
eukprot:CAMPEP_0172212614 /NCGR_PEP_ID=MMETSP1050-20130122/37117_1 /TAXON_ID=233186 /ORGANISM="Cryptomonas curvata, Strain CCAP979/52" /LENGTH=107 /DNA_ID=CAMNT_0012893319 /DNA_START=123 /DNA_END=443 /DNA_ORIENTATION=-